MFEPDYDISRKGQNGELTKQDKIIRSLVFVLILLAFLFWDGSAVFLQFFLLQWFWVPIILLICTFVITTSSILCFGFVTKYSIFPFAIMRLFMLVIVISLWSLNVLRWFNDNRNPSWRDGMDRVWTDVQALGFSYCILFGWLAISSVMLFIVFVIHYFPRMKMYPCCMDFYVALQPSEFSNQIYMDVDDEKEQGTELEDIPAEEELPLDDEFILD